MWKDNRVQISRPESEDVTGAESAPSLPSDGVACGSYRSASVTFTARTFSTFQIQVWVYDGAGWAQATDSAGAVIDIHGINTTWAQTFDVAGFDRFAVIVSAVGSAGQVTRQYSLSRY